MRKFYKYGPPIYNHTNISWKKKLPWHRTRACARAWDTANCRTKRGLSNIRWRYTVLHVQAIVEWVMVKDCILFLTPGDKQHKENWRKAKYSLSYSAYKESELSTRGCMLYSARVLKKKRCNLLRNLPNSPRCAKCKKKFGTFKNLHTIFDMRNKTDSKYCFLQFWTPEPILVWRNMSLEFIVYGGDMFSLAQGSQSFRHLISLYYSIHFEASSWLDTFNEKDTSGFHCCNQDVVKMGETNTLWNCGNEYNVISHRNKIFEKWLPQILYCRCSRGLY